MISNTPLTTAVLQSKNSLPKLFNLQWPYNRAVVAYGTSAEFGGLFDLFNQTSRRERSRLAELAPGCLAADPGRYRPGRGTQELGSDGRVWNISEVRWFVGWPPPRYSRVVDDISSRTKLHILNHACGDAQVPQRIHQQRTY